MCSLTPRSRRGPTSKRQARAVGWRIFHHAGLAFCCRSRLSSNVRHHKMRCVPSAAQNSRMQSRPHSSHPSLAATGEVSRLRHNVLVARYRSKDCSKKLRASRAAIVVPTTADVVQFNKPAASAGQGASHHHRAGGGRVTFRADQAPASPGSRRENTTASPSSVALSYAVLPNPSLEARPNIKTPGPRSGLAHFPPRGPGVLLSVPPQLER